MFAFPDCQSHTKCMGLCLWWWCWCQCKAWPKRFLLCWCSDGLHFHSCKALVANLFPGWSPSHLGVLGRPRMFRGICLVSRVLSLLPLALTGSSARIFFLPNTGGNLIPRTYFNIIMKPKTSKIKVSEEGVSERKTSYIYLYFFFSWYSVHLLQLGRVTVK